MGEAAVKQETRPLNKWEWQLLAKVSGWKDVYHPMYNWQHEVCERLADWGYLNRLEMFQPVPYRCNDAGRAKLKERPG